MLDHHSSVPKDKMPFENRVEQQSSTHLEVLFIYLWSQKEGKRKTPIFLCYYHTMDSEISGIENEIETAYMSGQELLLKIMQHPCWSKLFYFHIAYNAQLLLPHR